MTERDQTEGVSSIDPATLHERIARGDRVTLLDLRDRDEFEAWHVDGESVRVEQIPHVQFVAAQARGDVAGLLDEADLEEPIVAVCGRGEASAYAAGLLRDAGVDAVDLADGMEGWARVYVANELGNGIRQYYRPSSGCLSYLVRDGSEAILVDPLRAFVDRYVADADELGVDLTAVVDTHVHADHLSGLRGMAERTGAEPYLPEAAMDRGLAFEPTLLSDGDEIAVGDATVTAMHVPGHTSEMTALAVDGYLLSGDSLFVESVPRPDLEAGDAGAPELAAWLHESLHDRLLVLPDDTVVAPGHVAPGTPPNDDGAYTDRLGNLRERLPLLDLDRDAFVERVVSNVPPRPANFERIVAVNLGKETVDEEEAFELELGPNNCAI